MNKTLEFKQPKFFRQSFDILAHNKKTGELRYKGVRYYQASGYLDKYNWSFIQKGFVNTKIYIDDPSQGSKKKKEAKFVYIKSALKGRGSITIGKQEYFLEKVRGSSLRATYKWLDAKEKALIEYSYSGFFKVSGEVILTNQNKLSNETQSLLTLLGLFIVLNIDADSASVAAS